MAFKPLRRLHMGAGTLERGEVDVVEIQATNLDPSE